MSEPMVRAFVSGCSGLELTDEEIAFFGEAQPWGLILFRRNVESPSQLSALTARFRAAVGRADAPVLVDQEGGRVQRLGPPHWPTYPAGAAYARVAAADPVAGEAAARLGGRLIARDLEEAGLTIDCAPVLDLPVQGGTPAIGDRGFGTTPAAVARLGRAFAEGLMAGGILPVFKHVPGHGRALADSHFELPVVRADRAALEADFAPFRALADLPIGMTAHVVYTAIDPDRPATTSAIVIDRIVRGDIGFKGLLLSDDLSMQALHGGLGERAAAAIAAGCDIALHCNGKLDEARDVAASVPRLEKEAEQRADAALSRRSAPEALDVRQARARLERLMQDGSPDPASVDLRV